MSTIVTSDSDDEAPTEPASSVHVTELTTDAALGRGFLEAALDCVVIVDATGCVLEFNPSAEDTFGHSRKEALGRTLGTLLVPPFLRNRHQHAFDRFVGTREQRLFGQRIEVAAMRADGTEFPVELTLSLIQDEPLLICGAIRDISVEKQLTESLRKLADEQAALRQVATLVANGAGPDQVFSAVAERVAHVLGVPGINVIRFDHGSVVTKIAGSGTAPLDVGGHWALDDMSVMALVAREGRPARIDDYADVSGPFSQVALQMGLKSGIGAPILVNGVTWGVLVAYSHGPERFSDDTENRLLRFTELVGTAISNMHALDNLHRVLDEQTALRRVATLVAQATDLTDLFDRVCEITGQFLGASRARVVRYSPDRASESISTWRRDANEPIAGARTHADADSLEEAIKITLSPCRHIGGEALGEQVCAIGAPVSVENELFGALIVEADQVLAVDSETTVSRFAELLETALANAAARSQLLASRARIVTAGDEARRVLQRDIHDGVQQHMVASIIDLQLADERFDSDPMAVREGLRSALQSSQAGLEELRQLASGLHPRVLTRGGLQAALEAIADKSRLPVKVMAPDARYPSQLEAAAYFVVAEGLANVAKHARASQARVRVEELDGQLLISVEDDGIGGADPENGSGLRGLEDRIEALGGRLQIRSVASGGTSLNVSVPLGVTHRERPVEMLESQGP